MIINQLVDSEVHDHFRRETGWPGFPSLPEDPTIQYRRGAIGGVVNLSLLVVVVYDHALTIADEVNYIWRYPWNSASIIFLITRYVTVVTRCFDLFAYDVYRGLQFASCHIIIRLRIPALCLLVSHILIRMVLMLRVYALYGSKKHVLYGLTLVLAAEIVVSFLAAYLLTNSSDSRPDHTFGCLTMPSVVTITSVIWIAPLLVDTVIFVLTLWKSSHYTNSTRSLRLVKILVRDGIIYYLVITLTHVLNLLLFALAPPEVKPYATGFSQALATSLVTRLVFNLRKQYFQRLSANHGEEHTSDSRTARTSATPTYFTSIGTFFNAEQDVSHADDDTSRTSSLLSGTTTNMPYP